MIRSTIVNDVLHKLAVVSGGKDISTILVFVFSPLIQIIDSIVMLDGTFDRIDALVVAFPLVKSSFFFVSKIIIITQIIYVMFSFCLSHLFQVNLAVVQRRRLRVQASAISTVRIAVNRASVAIMLLVAMATLIPANEVLKIVCLLAFLKKFEICF